MLTKQKKNKLPAWQTGKTVTRPGTSNPTALLVFLEGFRLFAERDKFAGYLPKRKMPEMLDITSISDICGDLQR